MGSLTRLIGSLICLIGSSSFQIWSLICAVGSLYNLFNWELNSLILELNFSNLSFCFLNESLICLICTWFFLTWSLICWILVCSFVAGYQLCCASRAVLISSPVVPWWGCTVCHPLPSGLAVLHFVSPSALAGGVTLCVTLWTGRVTLCVTLWPGCVILTIAMLPAVKRRQRKSIGLALNSSPTMAASGVNSPGMPIGHTTRIFSVSDIPLVTRKWYFQMPDIPLGTRK